MTWARTKVRAIKKVRVNGEISRLNFIDLADESSSGYKSLDFPNSTVTYALGINKRGKIVGEYVDAAGVAHAFLAVPQKCRRAQLFAVDEVRGTCFGFEADNARS